MFGEADVFSDPKTIVPKVMDNINNKWMDIPEGSLDFKWDSKTFYTLGSDFAELLYSI